MRILVVDDHDALRKSMVDALARQEDVALVDGAANGAEALKLLCQRSYDVMVTDIIMPVMDGYTLMQEMRKLMPSPAPKVIVATALARDDFVMRAVELGAKFYLVKPFQPDILLGHIRRLARGEEAMPAVAPDAAPHEPSLDERLGSLFLTLGIPAHIKGYQYLPVPADGRENGGGKSGRGQPDHQGTVSRHCGPFRYHCQQGRARHSPRD